MTRALLLLMLLLLSGCGEASCWNDAKGKATSCEDMRRDERDRNP